MIYQHIEELSNMGDHEQAELLKQFVEEELEPGNVSSSLHFDDAYEAWKQAKLKTEIKLVAEEWGLNEVIFEKTVEVYSTAKPENIPYIDDLTSTVDYGSIENPKTNNLLEHNMKLMKKLPEIVPKLKRRFK